MHPEERRTGSAPREKKLETSDTHCSDRDETCKCSGQRTSVQELKEGDSEEDMEVAEGKSKDKKKR